MATAAKEGYGTLMKIGDGAMPEVFTTIAEVKDISGPSLSMDTIDVTNQSSTGAWEETIKSILRSGEVTFDVNFLGDATQWTTTGLLSKFTARTTTNFQLVWTNSKQVAFSALVTGFAPSAPVGDALTASITLKVTGVPTFT